MKTNENQADKKTAGAAEPEKNSFPVLNMHCASCAMNVENTVKKMEGVTFSNVNFANATLTVEFDKNKLSPEEIQKNIREIGFDIILGSKVEQEKKKEQEHIEHFQKMKQKTIWSAVFSVPVFIIGMFFMEIPYANWIMWGLATPVLLIFGRHFFSNAWKLALKRQANMDTLVALSTGVAYIFSVFNTLFPQIWKEKRLDSHVYFEASAVIITFILLGKLLEERAKGNTSAALKKLMGLQPNEVTIIDESGNQKVIPIQQLHIGDVVFVKPGEKIAVDGTVLSGESYVDESSFTGEPVPVLKTVDSLVLAGTINQKGSFTFKADKVGEDTLLSHIIKTVQDAQGSKAPVQKLADKIAGIFVPVVMGIALITLLTWIIFGGENGLSQGLLSMITVLVIACPCALGLATPTAIMVGIGKGAKNGILIKDAESLEIAKKVNAVVLDKTGTITEGKPIVTNTKWLKENEMMKSILLSLESQSEHPLAEAVVRSLNTYSKVNLTQFQSVTGKGVQAIFSGIPYFAGNLAFMEEQGLHISKELMDNALEWQQEAKTIIAFANSEQVLAIIAISDEIKPSSVQAIQLLEDQGIEVFMLTGDNPETAASIAKQAHIKHFQAGLLPIQKADFIKKLQSEGKTVAMVGDGINDSVALAQSDISIAMGKGSDIAMDVAKMTIISSDLTKIADAILLSKKTVRIIKQNLFWAFIYNVIGIPIAAGVLFPVFGFVLNPMIAGAAMALSSFSVVSNSLRLK